MSRRDALADVKAERERVIAARDALARRVGRVHPLVLVGGGLFAGLVAGRIFGRARLVRMIAPGSLLSGALQRPLFGLIEGLVGSLVAPASDDPKSASPPETPRPEP
jgi:hypothetical protein